MASSIRPTMTRSLSIPARPSCHHHQYPPPQAIIQTRHASSQRRARKLNNIAPAPLLGGPALPTGGTGRSRVAKDPLPDSDHIVYNPPPSAPNVYHTPSKFLPQTDIRWKLQQQQQQERSHSSHVPSAASPSSTEQSSSQEAEAETITMPRAVRAPYKKAYNLTPQDFEQMRKLRQEDEEYWTRSKLAQRFQCTQFFAGMVVQASDDRLKKLKQEQESWEDWARRKNPALLKIREDRQRRKALWTHEV